MPPAGAQGGEPQPDAAAPRRLTVPADGAARAATEKGSARRSRAWASVLHVNGVAVYVEEQDADGEGGAIMVRRALAWWVCGGDVRALGEGRCEAGLAGKACSRAPTHVPASCRTARCGVVAPPTCDCSAPANTAGGPLTGGIHCCCHLCS